MGVVGIENFLPMPDIEVGPSTCSSLNCAVDTHNSLTEVIMVIMTDRILSKSRILVAVEVLLTTLEYISLKEHRLAPMFCIHYAVINFYQETNLVECKHDVKQKMTSSLGMAKRLENIFRDGHKSHQFSVICC
jgi:hypothetical protein